MDDFVKVGTMGEADTIFRNPESSVLAAAAWAGPIASLQRRRRLQRQGRRWASSEDFCLAFD
jgi:hypothetical protein